MSLKIFSKNKKNNFLHLKSDYSNILFQYSKFSKKGVLIFLLLVISWSVSNSQSYSNTNQNNVHLNRPTLDDRIIDFMNDPGKADNIISIIIMFKEGISIFKYQYPNYLSITKYFSSINGVLARIRVKDISKIMYSHDIKSIWYDGAIKTDLNDHVDVSPFIRSAAQISTNPFYANFTGEIGATDLWAKGYNGSDVVIAVLDTGVDITGAAGGDLDDFDENTTTTDPKYLGGVSMIPYEPFYYSDFNGRGTFHAGIACGTGNINKSYIGVAPGAYYLNVKIYDSLGITYWSFIISGIEWAISHGADILLFAATIPGLYLDPVCVAVNNAVKKGVVSVVPVGDDGPGYMSINTPGQANMAIRVGAYNSFSGEIWNKSSRGPSLDFSVGPDLIAPGVGLIGPRSRIFSNESFDMLQSIGSIAEQYGYNLDYNLDIDTTAFSMAIPYTIYGEDVPNEPNYTRASGTGAAAAVVAGALALLISAFPLANPVLLQQALMKTATPITINNNQNTEGAGFINVSAAFDWLSNLFTPNEYKILPLSVPLLYAGVVTSSDYQNVSQYSEIANRNLLEYDVSGIFSTQAMFTALMITNSTEPDAMNMSSIHLPLNQFGVEYTLSNTPDKKTFHWFSEFNVIREMHQLINTQFYQEGYNRYVGVLGLDGLYIAVIAETWSYAGEYNDTTFQINATNPFYNFTIPTEYNMMNITDRVEAIKLSFHLINNRLDQQSYENISLISYFKADLYVNETGLASETTSQRDLGSALNFSLDDTVKFNQTTQTLWVEDKNNNTDFVSDDKYTAMGFKSSTHDIKKYSISDSIGLLANITINHLNAPVWNDSNNNPNSLYGNGEIDPGFAAVYSLGNLSYGNQIEFQGALSIGQSNSTENARNTMEHQFDLIFTNVTTYNITDLMVLQTNISRMTSQWTNYYSHVKVINIGTTNVSQAQLAFAVNRTNEEDVVQISSTIYTVKNIEPFQILDYEAKWVPLEIGVYVAGWVFGELSDPLAMQLEANILSNTLGRSVFVVNGSYYSNLKTERFMAFPTKMDQEPMKIFAPLDYAIYNITALAIWKIPDVTISADGLGKKMSLILSPNLMDLQNQMNDILPSSLSENSTGTNSTESTSSTSDTGNETNTDTTSDSDSNDSTSDDGGLGMGMDMGGGSSGQEMPSMSLDLNLPTNYTTDLQPYSQILFVLFGNPLVPPGLIEFNVTFSIVGEDGQEIFYRIPVELHMYPNRGRVWFDVTHLNFFVSPNIVGSDAFAGITDPNASNETMGSTDFLNDISSDVNSSDTNQGVSFSNLNDLQFNTTQNFDLTRFIDLNERLDTTWGNFYKLRQIWADPKSNNGKGASVMNVIPFISLNITNATGINITEFRMDNLIPSTSFLGKTLGNYFFQNDVFTTNWINHDVLQLFDLVVLNDPEQALLPKEITNITSWVEEGGTLFVWSEDAYHTNVQSLNELLKNFDMQLSNESFYPSSEYGLYQANLTLNDIYSDLFQGTTDIKTLTMKDPVHVSSINGTAEILVHGTMGIKKYGKGRVFVIGDNDILKEGLIGVDDNSKFAERLLNWGLENHFDMNITVTPTEIPMYEQAFVDVNITNYDDILSGNLTSKGFLFVAAFFYENGTMINASLYGFSLPMMPMFHTDNSHYAVFLDSTWYLFPGDFYIMMLIDHPAAASELAYVKIHVYAAPPPVKPERYHIPDPEYPHYMDIIGILFVTYMGLMIWYYDLEKYKKRLRITPLKGDFLNIAQTRINEGKTLLKLLLRGIDKSEVEEIEKIRYLLSVRKRLTKYLKELKRFGERIGEHY